MTQFHFIGTGLLLLFMSTVQSDQKAAMEVSTGNNAFALELLQELLDTSQGENQVFSPYSINAVLGMTYIGANGATQTQIQQGLHYPADRETVFKGHQELQRTLNGDLNVTLETANKLYVAEEYELLPDFEQKANEYFDAVPARLDFGKNVEAAKTINDEVAEITHDKIKDLIHADSLDDNTKLVLVNGIYFKGLWDLPFKKSLSSPEDFYLNSVDPPVKTQMMFQESKFFYADINEINAQVLFMQYQGKKVEMAFILPKTKDGLADTVRKLKDYSWENVVKAVSKVKVRVVLPTFKIETSLKLRSTLEKLGMVDMFTPAADFSGIAGKKDLLISEAVQKAFIEVNEEGAEAAAATGLIMVGFARPLAPEIVQNFRADHPFIYAIREVQTGAALFMGTYQTPKQE